MKKKEQKWEDKGTGRENTRRKTQTKERARYPILRQLEIKNGDDAAVKDQLGAGMGHQEPMYGCSGPGRGCQQ